MRSWEIRALEAQPRRPEILASTDEARAVVIDLPAGERLQEHEVHERAWVLVVEGELEATTAVGERVTGGPGLLVEFAPRERHQVAALSDARLLLLLTPWPGAGHPGPMTVEQKADVRERAAKRAET